MFCIAMLTLAMLRGHDPGLVACPCAQLHPRLVLRHSARKALPHRFQQLAHSLAQERKSTPLLSWPCARFRGIGGLGWPRHRKSKVILEWVGGYTGKAAARSGNQGRYERIHWDYES